MNDKRNTQSTDLKGKYEQPKVELYSFSDDIVQTSGGIIGTFRTGQNPLNLGQ